MKFFAIVPASGSGERFGGDTPKQFLKLTKSRKTVLSYTLEKLDKLRIFDSIYIAVRYNHKKKVTKMISELKLKTNYVIVEGGAERQHSVENAFKIISAKNNDRIFIHDAVRPFVTKQKLQSLINESKKNSAIIPGLKINDTVKEVNKNNYTKRTIPRENIWRIQTPQIFSYEILKKSFAYASKKNLKVTDEASLVEAAGYKVKVVPGEVTNIKITTPDDLQIVNYTNLLK